MIAQFLLPAGRLPEGWLEGLSREGCGGEGRYGRTRLMIGSRVSDSKGCVCGMYAVCMVVLLKEIRFLTLLTYKPIM